MLMAKIISCRLSIVGIVMRYALCALRAFGLRRLSFIVHGPDFFYWFTNCFGYGCPYALGDALTLYYAGDDRLIDVEVSRDIGLTFPGPNKRDFYFDWISQ